jgi:probable F420-dependent oxidoreductase
LFDFMKFGVNTFVTDETIRPTVLGRALEERGFDSLWLAEHSHIPASRETPYPGGGELPPPYYRALDPFVVLPAVAAVTENLLLATGITLLIQRDTIHTAKSVASLDHISGGRVLFGVGVGWNREEMRNHGTDPRTRGALMDEQLDAMIELWTRDKAEFHGKFVDFDPSFAWPKPVRKPHPPIYVGGNSPAAVARANRYGGWLPMGFSDPAKVAGVVAQVRPGVAITVGSIPQSAELIAACAEAGVERVTFYLPHVPEDDGLRQLDKFAELIS